MLYLGVWERTLDAELFLRFFKLFLVLAYLRLKSRINFTVIKNCFQKS